MTRFAGPTKSEVKTVVSATCIHHWKLDPPIGGVTRGECAKCGAGRHFTEPLQPEFVRRYPRH